MNGTMNINDVDFNKCKNNYIQVGRGEHAKHLDFQHCGFDIETTTQYTKDENGKVIEHFSNMYIWQFSLNGKVYFGRTWKEFSDLLKMIEKHFCSADKKFVIFIHNQSFEFSFFSRELNFLGHNIKIFARKKRKPMSILVDDMVLFLDTYLITGYSLAKLAENYCITQKLKGDLDYKKIRNSKTPLSEKELDYCINDVLILSEYAEYYEERFLRENFMPLTKTMIANKVVKDSIKEYKAQKEVFFLMQKAYPKNRKQYEYIMSFYTGAYTHGMLRNLFEKKKNGLAFDVTSEYPYVMMSKYFPMGHFRRLVDLTKIDAFLKKYCCLIDVYLCNIKTKTGVTILSKHKLKECEKATWDNGRLFKAKKVRARITEVDLQVLYLHYDFEIQYNSCIYTERGYLPIWFRMAIARLYKNKSILKGVEGKEIEYMESKEELNGQYGSCCTALEFLELFWNNDSAEWGVHDKDIDFLEIIKSKNKLPQWAIYITAHSRYLILSTIAKIKPIDYWYSDTDSIKCAMKKYILKMFNEVNEKIREENKVWINELMLESEDFEGVDFAQMGTFDRESDLIYFKSLGSKRYLSSFEKDGKIVTKETVAGLPKGTFVKWANEKMKKEKNENGDIYDYFTEDGIAISDLESNKLCTYYCDEDKIFDVIDEYGNKETYNTHSYVSLIPTSFNVKVGEELKDLYASLAYNLEE